MSFLHLCKDDKTAPHKCMNQVRHTRHSGKALPHGRSTRRIGTNPVGRSREGEGVTKAGGRKKATWDNEKQRAKTGNAIGIDGRHGAMTGSPREET